MQIALVGWLAYWLFKVEDETLQQAKGKEIVCRANLISSNFQEIIIELFISRTHGLDTSVVETETRQMRENEEALGSLMLASAQQKQDFEKLAALLDRLVSMVNTAKKQIYAPTPRYFAACDRAEMGYIQLALNFQDVMREIIQSVPATGAEGSASASYARQAIRIALFLALICSLLFSAVVAKVASRTIIGRLQRLTTTAGLIAKRQPLPAPMEGSDELAELDKAFHGVDRAISEALGRERNLIDGAADLVLSINHDGRIISTNEYVKTLLGYQPQAFLRLSLWDLVLSEDCDKADQKLKEIAVDSAASHIELRIRHHDGHVLYSDWSILRSAVNETIFCVVHDVTEQRQLDQMKRDFIAMISHDLKAPLTSVQNTVKSVLEGATGEISQRAREDLSNVEHNITSLVDLVSELLDLETLEAGRMDLHMQAVNMKDVIADSIGMLKALAEQQAVHMDSAIAKNVIVHGDRGRLQQVLVNFLGNAIKHSPKDGHVTVDALVTSDAAEFSVSDQGPGVPEHLREKIFLPFGN